MLVVHPHMDVLGGSEVLTAILLRELAEWGVDLALLTGGVREGLVPGGVRVYRLSRPGRPSLREALERVHQGVWDALDDYEPDVVLVMIQEPVYAMAVKARRPGLGVAIYIHYPFEEEAGPGNIERFISLLRFPNMYNDHYGAADLHMVNSNYTARALYKSYGIEANVVYPAVSWEFYSAPPPEPGEKDRWTIASLGRLVPAKGFHKLIEAHRILRSRIPQARLVIIGVPDERFPDYPSELERLAERAGGVELVFKPLDRLGVARALREARVYAHLRVGEHFGMAPVEAMTQGTVPVIPGRSGLAELVRPGRTGFLLPSDDPRVVAGVLERVLSMEDREYAEVSLAAYRASLYFTPHRFASQVLHYTGIVAAGGGGGGV